MRFRDRAVLVAGGTGGLGRAVSLAFLNEGAKVIVTYRSEREFTELAAVAGANAALLTGRQADVTDKTAVTGLVTEIETLHGGLNVLVNTVGAFAGGSKLWEADIQVFDRMLDLNLRAGLLLIQAAAPGMIKQQAGSIVNVASKAAYEPMAAAAGYAASKAAAVAMLNSLAEDLKGTKVRANSVLPGTIDTEANRKAMPNADFSKWPKPEDIARVILFLCSDEAKVIHGASIPVYGSD